MSTPVTPSRPFPRTALDEAVLCTEGRHPLTVLLHAELEAGAPVDDATLSARWRSVAALHPRAAARLAGRGRWAPVAPGELTVATQRGPIDPVVARECRRPVDLRHEPGVRVTLVADGRRRHVVVVAHHALLDGRGALELLAALLGGAPSATTSTLGGERAVDPDAAMGSAGSGPLRGLAPAMAPGPGRSPGHDGQVLATACWTDADTAALRGGGVGVSAVLLAASHGAAAAWNRQHAEGGGRAGDGRVVVTAPVRPTSAPTPGNATGACRTTTTDADRAEVVSLLRRLDAELAAAAAHPSEPAAVLGALRRLPLRPRRWAARVAGTVVAPAVRSTLRTSNLGQAEATVGALAGVARLWFAPPATVAQPVVVGAVTIGGSLHLTVRALARHLGRDDAVELARLVHEEATAIAEAARRSQLRAG